MKYLDASLVDEIQEYRSTQCWKDGYQHHRKCSDWNCECGCHEDL